MISAIIYCYNQAHQLPKIMATLGFVDEIILADDGSTDGTREWAREQKMKITGPEVNTGFGIVPAINQAVKESKGEYLLFLGGDTYLDERFFDEVEPYLKPNRVLNFPRFNVNFETGKILSNDWRVDRLKGYGLPTEADFITFSYGPPWGYMQINAMIVSRKCWEDVGGMDERFSGEYGCCDTDFCAHAHFKGYEMCWVTKAIAYHKDHPGKKDGVNNARLLEEKIVKYKQQYAKNSH